jgi:hypothetical protein
MYHLVYKITNLITGRYYIGKHSTRNIDDNYFGSCKPLNEDIGFYGKENFQKEILFQADSEEEALEYEAKLVTQEMIDSLRTYNQTLGGRGSWQNPTTENYAKQEQINKFERSVFTKELVPPKRDFKKKKPDWGW